MAPEQVESAGTVTARADVYSLGAILYELLTGNPPHVADTVERLLFKILAGSIEPIGSLRVGVPPELSRVVQRALSRDQADRYANAQELGDALRRAAPASGVLPITLGGELSLGAPRAAKHGRWLWPSLTAAFLSIGVLAFARAAPDAAQNGTLLPVAPRAASVAQGGARAEPTLTPPAPTVTSPSAEGAVPVAPRLPSSAAAAPSVAAGPKRTHPTKRTNQSAPVAQSSAVTAAPQPTTLPKIRFELDNPYGG
jgi:serine/threonine-protein kinase